VESTHMNWVDDQAVHDNTWNITGVASAYDRGRINREGRHSSQL